MTKVAIVHDWLDKIAGSERVLEQLFAIFPSADLYTLVDYLQGPDRVLLAGRSVKTSFLQRLPGGPKHFRRYLPLMPIAVEQFDLSAYELIISSSHAVAKGVLTGPDQLHLSYVHSPMRYAWDLQHEYLRQSGLDRGVRSWLARATLHYLRTWDVRTANGVDVFIANSEFIARRIRKVYGREAEVVYPPVDLERFDLSEGREDYYLTTSRLVPYKRVDLIVRAFEAMPDRKLVVVGTGPERKHLERVAPKNVRLLGFQSLDRLVTLTQRARAFIFASLEDFGIATVEAQACGTPVIAYARGGSAETVRGLESDTPTGVLFEHQDAGAIKTAVLAFEQNENRFDPRIARENAKRFSPDAFREAFVAALEHARSERGE